MAGDVAFTELLLAMGLRSYSMHPAQLSSVKQRLLRADSIRLAAALPETLASEDPAGEWSRLTGLSGRAA
jgi:phosphotransferase system enzyme I (PtsI)